MRSVGKLEPDNATAIINGALEAVGPKGTLLSLAHSGYSTKRAADVSQPFNRWSRAVTGGLSNAIVDRNDAVRSSHPTNSIIALGAQAKELVDYHDADGNCFGFVRRLIELDAPMMLLGCVHSGPGFSTLDFAQLELGLTTSRLINSKVGAYIDTPNGVKWMERTDHPGCSLGFAKLYPHYLAADAVAVGYVGRAYSMIGRSESMFEVDMRVVSKDARAMLCDNPDCLSCRANRSFNRRDIPMFLARRGRQLAMKALGRTN